MDVGTSKFAEFIGIVLGDGSLGIYRCKSGDKIKTQHRLQITLNSVDDREYIIYVMNLITELFGVVPRTLHRSGKTFDIRVFRKGIVKFLIEDVGLKTAPKKNRAEIPEFYINSSHELDVIRGCFDTDGSVVLTNNNGTLYPRLELKVCKSPMQTQIIDILERNGFRFGVYNVGSGEIRIQLNGKKQLKQWIDKIGFSNPKHYSKVNKIRGIAGGGFEFGSDPS